MLPIEIVVDVIQSIKNLYIAFGLMGTAICLLIFLLFIDMKFNTASGSKFIINVLLRLFKQKNRLRNYDLKDHMIFERIDRFLIKLKMYSTTSNFHRNIAKASILTIKWLVIKQEFTTLVTSKDLYKGDFKNKVMKTFEKFLERYEDNLKENLPHKLVDAYLLKANIRHPEMFLVIENFLEDTESDDMHNLSNIFSYVSSYMLLDSADSDKIFEEMNGTLSEHNKFLEDLDLDKIKIY